MGVFRHCRVVELLLYVWKRTCCCTTAPIAVNDDDNDAAALHSDEDERVCSKMIRRSFKLMSLLITCTEAPAIYEDYSSLLAGDDRYDLTAINNNAIYVLILDMKSFFNPCTSLEYPYQSMRT